MNAGTGEGRRHSPAANQRRILLRLLAALRPWWRRDRKLPLRIQQLLAREHSFGSRDRRLYRELIYTTLRYLPWVEPLLTATPEAAAGLIAWLAEERPETTEFRRLATVGWPTRPVSIDARTRLVASGMQGQLPPRESLPGALPEWFREHCAEAFVSPEIEFLLSRASLWIRLQSADPAPVLKELADRGWPFRSSSVLPDAFQILAEADLARTSAYATGRIEIQDLGSQLLLASVGIEPGGRWLDACAGAGGKTLQLARMVGPAGSVAAHDVREEALAELAERARRAGLRVSTLGGPANESGGVTTPPAFPAAPIALTNRPQGPFDGVLVDAPCSGSGTWRRAPHLKWMTTPGTVAAYARTQLRLLSRFADRVRPGGRLVYATCSLSRRENEEIVASFLREHPEFEPAPPSRTFGFSPGPLGGLTVLPSRHDTDGFFVAGMRRT